MLVERRRMFSVFVCVLFLRVGAVQSGGRSSSCVGLVVVGAGVAAYRLQDVPSCSMSITLSAKSHLQEAL